MKRRIKNMNWLGAAVLLAAGVGIGMVLGKKKEKVKTDKQSLLVKKNHAILKLFSQWILTKQEGKSIVNYLHENNVKTVAIYGMSFVGERLFDELKDSDIEVKYAIDQNANAIFKDVDMYTPDQKLPDVDMIIVTAIYFFDEIDDKLSEVTDCPVVSLENILYEI